jgi:hypothetical protein
MQAPTALAGTSPIFKYKNGGGDPFRPPNLRVFRDSSPISTPSAFGNSPILKNKNGGGTPSALSGTSPISKYRNGGGRSCYC